MNILSYIYYLVGKRYQSKKRWAEAINYYHKAQSDSNAIVNYRLGFCYEKKKDYVKASCFLQKAIENTTTKPHWYFCLAHIQTFINSPHEAIQNLKSGLSENAHEKL